MAGYLTDTQIASYRTAMAKLHETFARDIVVYQSVQRVVISTNPNHNFLYGSGPNQTETQNSIVKNTYKARIYYPNEEGFSDLLRSGGSQNSDQVNTKQKDYKVILVVTEEVKDIVIPAKRVTFDDTVYEVDSDPRPHGVVGVQFYNIYLKGLN